MKNPNFYSHSFCKACFLLVFICSFSFESQSQCHLDDFNALKNLYSVTNGSTWDDNTGWDLVAMNTAPPLNCDLSTMEGVSLNANGRVDRLLLNINNLTGTIGSELNTLTELEILNLGSNSITGPAPNISALVNLTFINLSLNQLTGTLPDVSNLINLEYLNLGRNNFYDQMPAFIQNPKLQTLRLTDCTVFGIIPDLSHLPDLELLWVGSNELISPLPDLSSNIKLKTIRFDRNDFTGTIPTNYFSTLTDLESSVYLDANDFTGPIPDFSNNIKLKDLRMAFNDFTGPIPGFVTNVNLTQLYLNSNNLEGCYPESLCDLPLINYSFSTNPMLPDNGSLAVYNQYCMSRDIQDLIGQSCDADGSTATPDVIQPDCTCAVTTTCLLGGITITTQQEIDDFAMDYPGCIEVMGELIIQEATPGEITNLDGLAQLEIVRGRLWVLGNSGITTLSGLHNIRIVDGFLAVNQCPNLVDLSGFESVETIGGKLSIIENISMLNFNGLDNVMTIGESIEVYNNPELLNLIGMNSLVSVGGGLIIVENVKMIDLSGLSSLTSFNDEVVIFSNLSMLSLSGLENIITIDGGLTLWFNPLLTDITALTNLTAINGLLKIESNSSLVDITPLQNIDYTSINDLVIKSNAASVCHIRNVCDYLSNTGTPVDISSNQLGCNSVMQVLDACALSCITNIRVDADPILNSTYHAGLVLGSEGKVDISGNVEFKAGDSIELDEGFEVLQTATFHASIVLCTQ